jgi:hypothetical protein
MCVAISATRLASVARVAVGHRVQKGSNNARLAVMTTKNPAQAVNDPP